MAPRRRAGNRRVPPRRSRWLRRTLQVAGLLVLAAIVAVVALFYKPDLSLQTLKERYADADSRFLPVGPLTVHYRDVGPRDGPVLVLLHGANASLHTWQGWADRLKDRFRVVSLDLPGYGLTGAYPEARPGDYHLVGYSTFLERFADALHLDRFALAGNSLGGGVAWTFAARHPERVGKLILVDALAYPQPTSLSLPQRIADMPVVGDLLLYVAPRDQIAAVLRSAYGDPAKVTDALIDRYRDLLRYDGNRAAMLMRLRHPDKFDSAPLKTLAMPVLILWGGKDSWIAPSTAFRLQQDIPNAQLQIFSEAGHLPMEEMPDQSAAAARKFLEAP
jgi:pimeloyl-ACP methyl ester carboxylesterase